MSKFEFAFHVVTFMVALANLLMVVGFLAKKLHATLIEKYITSLKTDLVRDLNVALTNADQRLKALEAVVTKQPTSVVSPTASSTPADNQPNPSASSPSGS